MGYDQEAIKDAIIKGKHQEIEALVREAIEAKANPEGLINDVMIAAMDTVGKKFAANEIYVPEMLVSALTMKKGLELIKPLLKTEGAGAAKGTIVMGTVKGDIHDIGKNLVVMMLQGAGFNVFDLGVDLSSEQVIAQVEKIKPDILGLSALLTTSMPEMKKVIEALKEGKLRDRVKVMVGGAPLNTAFAEKIGADGYGKNATEAVELARHFVAERAKRVAS
jgi:5-methyltetrahydrofolate--homocysteine methyltransferase